jgi:hypothetical protein
VWLGVLFTFFAGSLSLVRGKFSWPNERIKSRSISERGIKSGFISRLCVHALRLDTIRRDFFFGCI